jgi:hypothetical protein
MEAIQLTQINEQVLIRLIISGMYPLHRNKGGWMYFITEKGEYIGTPKKDDFEKYWTETLYFKGEGQMTPEEILEVRKIDYQLTEEYKDRFEKWKAKVLE